MKAKLSLVFIGASLSWASCQEGVATVKSTTLNSPLDTAKKLEYLTLGIIGPDDSLLNQAALKLGFEFHTAGCEVNNSTVKRIKKTMQLFLKS